MSTELKRAQFFEKVNRLEYSARPCIETSGRHIKSLRYMSQFITDNTKKTQCEYTINKDLTKHLILLQEAIVSGTKKIPQKRTIPEHTAKAIQQLSTSQYGVTEGKYSFVDVEELKKLKIISRAVVLKNPLVLPCNVISQNKQYKFKTEIIMTPTNVLAYIKGNPQYDTTAVNVNHNTLLTKVGKGIVNNKLVQKGNNPHLTK